MVQNSTGLFPPFVDADGVADHTRVSPITSACHALRESQSLCVSVVSCVYEAVSWKDLMVNGTKPAFGFLVPDVPERGLLLGVILYAQTPLVSSRPLRRTRMPSRVLLSCCRNA